MSTTQSTPWKISHPESVGFYIASTQRRPDYVRCWTGKHWTAPVHVGDLHLPGRGPQLDWEQADVTVPIEWLEPVTIGPDGFVSWGGLVNEYPMKHRRSDVEVRLRNGEVHRPAAPRDLVWLHGCGEADIVAYRVVEAVQAAQPSAAPRVGIGDVTSTARGSGARFNAGKPDLSLIPLRLIANSFNFGDPGPQQNAQCALDALGEFQQTHDVCALYRAIDHLGLDGWEDCARVFEYGKAKYAAWNWAKGMAWSVALACAARHLLAIMRGEQVDPESGKPHRGHAKCNLVMLLTFVTVFPEGNDLPTRWLDEVSRAA